MTNPEMQSLFANAIGAMDGKFKRGGWDLDMPSLSLYLAAAALVQASWVQRRSKGVAGGNMWTAAAGHLALFLLTVDRARNVLWSATFTAAMLQKLGGIRRTRGGGGERVLKDAKGRARQAKGEVPGWVIGSGCVMAAAALMLWGAGPNQPGEAERARWGAGGGKWWRFGMAGHNWPIGSARFVMENDLQGNVYHTVRPTHS